VLLHCHAGCRPEAVLRAAGLTWRDLFPPSAFPACQPWPRAWRTELEAPLLARERRAQARLEPYRDWFSVNDYLRHQRQSIAELRALASAVGDTEGIWRILAQLADRERFVNGLEAEVDDALRGDA
jgi:hypothetical protein